MAGVILETLSNRKLLIFGVCLLLLQFIFFLVGGLVAPAPFYAQNIIATKCLDRGRHIHKKEWFVPFGPEGETKCESVEDISDPRIEEGEITANQLSTYWEVFFSSLLPICLFITRWWFDIISCSQEDVVDGRQFYVPRVAIEVVFAMRAPLPKDGEFLDMSRWFQNLIGVLSLTIHYDSRVPVVEGAVLTMDTRLSYKNKWDGPNNWTELVRSTEERKLECRVVHEQDGYPLDCSPIPLFELGSCHHDYYLINIRVPVHEEQKINIDIGALKDMEIVMIFQTGGFTKVWFSIKTIFFPVVLAALVFYCKRVKEQVRPANLLEKTLFMLGCVISLLNLPVEWFTLWVHMPYMLLYADIRQGLFYSALLCFWIIFTGEHLMDAVERNKLVMYWKHLSAVAFGCICLFIFEMCERGVQLTNPFYSLWATETGTNLGYTFVILAGIAACLYFVFICYMIFRVMRNISAKKSALPDMTKARRKYYLGLIFRFKFLMVATLICAALTVIFFIIGQVSESTWKWGDENHLQYTSAFLTGVYAMWNLYVIALLVLYSPSHKYISAMANEDENSEDENIEFSNVPAETSALQSFATKSAQD